MSSQQPQETIENPTLELKIISANDVTYIDATEKMDVYAIVSIKSENTQLEQAAKTPIDYDGGSNPTWNHNFKFSVNEIEVNEGLLTIYIKLFSYCLEGKNDLYLGEISVLVHELLASNSLSPFPNGKVDKMKLVTYPVKVIGETKSNTKLSLSYRFKPVPVKTLYPSAPDYSLSIGQPVYPNPEPIQSGQPNMYSRQLQVTTVAKVALELVIKSAKDIKKVNMFNEMDAYASVRILEGKKTIKQRTNTPVVFSAYLNPKWEHHMTFSMDELLSQHGDLKLVVELMSHRPIFGDKQIGEVKVSIKDLLGMNPPSLLTNGDDKNMMLVTRDVSGSYGKKGTLSFTYRFLVEQVIVPKSQSSTTPQPFTMYPPISRQAQGSQHWTQGPSGYVSVHPRVHVGPSNGERSIYMPSSYQSNGYQHYLSQKSQLEPQESQLQPQPQPDTQSQLYQSYGYQHYASPEEFAIS